MTTLEQPVKELEETNVEILGKLVSDIRNGKLRDTLKIALATISILEQIISESQNATAYELCAMLHAVGKHIGQMLPNDIVAGNMVRRVLRAVRDESRAHANQSEVAGESLQRLVLAAPSRRATLGPNEQDLREPIRDQIAELRAELESTEASISGQARSHIDTNEVVLVCGGCAVLEGFLRAAARATALTLIVAEGHDRAESHGLAARLSAAGANVTVISNVAIFAVMSRVNKVVIGVRAAIGGGAVLAAPGVLLLTSAAKMYNVPVLALTPLFKLTPLHATDPQYTALASPLLTHTYEHADSQLNHVFCPLHDFITPDHITLFITNLGGSSPSYIYRLLSELYDARDNNLATFSKTFS